MDVQTIKGLIPRDQLEVKDTVEEGDNHRSITTEWTHNGELVKRDCHVIIFRGQQIAGQQQGV